MPDTHRPRVQRADLRNRGPLRALSCAVVLAVSSAGVARAQALPRLEAASARVSIAAAGRDAEVLLRYAVAVAAPAEEIGVRAIPFFGLVPEDVDVSVDGAPASLELTGDAAGALHGRITAGAALPSDRVFVVELRYRVPGALAGEGERVDVRVPLLIPVATPASTAGRFFDAELLTPPGVSLVESFPTVPVSRQSVASGERFTMTLQVVPSLLRWRATTGRGPVLTFAAAVDVGLLLLIAALAVAGVRALRRRA